MNKTSNPNTSTTDLQAQIAELVKENERLQAKAKSALTFKVSDKGCVSVYGLQRFPTSLYPDGWDRLLAAKDEILAFVEQNREKTDAIADARKSAKEQEKEEKKATKDASKGTVVMTGDKVARYQAAIASMVADGIDRDTATRACTPMLK